MAVDKEAISLSRVYSYYSMCNNRRILISLFSSYTFSIVDIAGSIFHTAMMTASSPTVCTEVQNDLAPTTVHSYFTLFKLLCAFRIHTRSSSTR